MFKMEMKSAASGAYAALAPMAGVADRAMRELCRGFGSAFSVGELASAKGISMGDKKSFELLEISDAERPMGSQLFGCEPEIMAQAAKKALEYKPDFIDINMGCPTPKVIKSGGGSSLLRDLPLAEKIIRAVVRMAAPVPVSVKFRTGWDRENIIARELALRAEDAGAASLTLHARTRDQMYAPGIDLDSIALVKQSVTIPVIGNGDIFTPFDAANMYDHTGCDLVMVGRGAMGRPWIFSQINAYLKDGTVLPDPSIYTKMHLLLRQVKKMAEYKGEYIALREARKHAAWYMRGLNGAAGFRALCGELKTFAGLEELTLRVIEKNL
ncbi:MAG TPA: tRNA dihydrouridine synthase DusB [Ruminococcaceae bacterium]|nr:tRNA dihydrouridine synthase DusB [Oscillospiraceae bacterium]